MLTRKRCKMLADLQAAIDQFERNLAYHNNTAGHSWPEQLKILLRVQFFPVAEATYLKITFVKDRINFHAVRDRVFQFANNERLAAASRGIKPMDVDSLR